MGALEQAVEAAIAAMVDRMHIKQVLSGTIIKVGETTCDVEREDAPTLYDVRLNAIDDDLQTYVTIYPAVGSSVLIGVIECLKTEAVVLRCSEVAKVKVKIGNETVTIDNTGTVINGTNVTQWMQKVYTDMQTLKTTLASSPVAGNGTPAAIVFEPTVTSVTQ